MKNKLKLFNKIFPNEKVTSIKEAEGCDNQILEINNKWIIKSSKSSSVNSIETEAKLLKLLENKISINIPKVIYYNSDLIIYQKISGIELSIEFYNKFNKDQKERLAKDIASFLYQLHNALTDNQIKELNIAATDWPWNPEKLKNKQYLIIDSELKTIFSNFIEIYKDSRKNYKSSLIHNDIDLRNIIIDPKVNKLSGIIDFTDVAYDDFYLDLRARYSMPYELTEDIAKNYSEISGLNRNMQKAYTYYIATEFSRYLELKETNKSCFDLTYIKNRIKDAAVKLQRLI